MNDSNPPLRLPNDDDMQRQIEAAKQTQRWRKFSEEFEKLRAANGHIGAAAVAIYRDQNGRLGLLMTGEAEVIGALQRVIKQNPQGQVNGQPASKLVLPPGLRRGRNLRR